MNPVNVIRGDIVTLDVGAIVNAANSTLLGGGGVDGAIHAAAGPELLEACRKLNGCPTGEARITPGFRLRARWVIHTVGPAHGIDTIAFPAISTGAYGYPIELATDVAIETVARSIEDGKRTLKVTFCCYSRDDFAIYHRVLKGRGTSFHGRA